jgi:hypothetical protein
MSIARTKSFVLLQAHPGRNVLFYVSNPKVKLAPADRQGPLRHDVVVLPISKGLEFLDRAREIPDWTWEPVRAGTAKVVLDASLEGQPHEVKRTRRLHDFFRAVGVPRRQVVYLTQDRGYEADYRQSFEGADGEPLMKVMVHDFWIRWVARQHAEDGREVFAARLAAYRGRSRRRERRFLALTRNLRASKALFLLRLLRDGLWDQGFISVGGLQERRAFKGFSQDELEAELFREAPFADLNESLRPLLPRLEAFGRIEFSTGEPRQRFREVMDEGLAEYGRSWFSVITETEMRERVLRVTEKPLKALMNFHPFIVLGNPGSLELLRQYGFESYPGLFDEAYDQEADPRRRFEGVFREVERLCALEEAELDRLETQVEETVIRNAWRALVELPQLYRDRLDPELVGEVLTPA